jgi:hypothetical protein
LDPGHQDLPGPLVDPSIRPALSQVAQISIWSKVDWKGLESSVNYHPRQLTKRGAKCNQQRWVKEVFNLGLIGHVHSLVVAKSGARLASEVDISLMRCNVRLKSESNRDDDDVCSPNVDIIRPGNAVSAGETLKVHSYLTDRQLPQHNHRRYRLLHLGQHGQKKTHIIVNLGRIE